MEELRSTEILDREIQDDARRKADKILKASDAECLGIAESVSVRIQKTEKEKEAEYNRRLEHYQMDIESAIPLEKQRQLVLFTDTSVQEALDAWFRDIGKAKRLELIKKLLVRYISVLGESRLRVVYAGYEEGEIRSLVSELFGKEKIESIRKDDGLRHSSKNLSDGVNIETDDDRIICRASLEEIRTEILSTNRQELAEALMGGRLPE